MYIKLDKMIEDINLLNPVELNRVIEAVKFTTRHGCSFA